MQTEPTQDELARGRRFSEWVCNAVQGSGLRVKNIADQARLSANAIGVYVNGGIDKQTGKVRQPSEETIRKIALATGADENIGRVAAGYMPRSRPIDPELVEIKPGTRLYINGRVGDRGTPLRVDDATIEILRQLSHMQAQAAIQQGEKIGVLTGTAAE